MMKSATQSRQTTPSNPPLFEQVEKVMAMIRPAVQLDGGDVELIDVTSTGVVRVRLHGACIGCPSSEITLKTGIERNLKDRVPGVTGVEALS